MQRNDGAIKDAMTAKMLELTANQSNTPQLHNKNTLMGIFRPYISTSNGARLLRATLLQPSTDKVLIESRLNLVEALCKNSLHLKELKMLMSGMKDLDRIISNVSFLSLLIVEPWSIDVGNGVGLRAKDELPEICYSIT